MLGELLVPELADDVGVGERGADDDELGVVALAGRRPDKNTGMIGSQPQRIVVTPELCIWAIRFDAWFDIVPRSSWY